MELTKKQLQLLAESQGCSIDDLDLEDFEILTDGDADQKVRDCILDLLWAFNPSFLANHAKEGIDQDVFEAIQKNDRCEDNNEAIKQLIKDVDYLIEDAVKCDGRGHFLSGYDGEEIELSDDLYAYRIN